MFYSGKIDLVIGSDLTPKIFLSGVKNVSDSLLAQNTIFGWILSGPVQAQVSAFSTRVEPTPADSLCDLLKRFWEQEDFVDPAQPSEEDQICETLYQNTTIRRADGRYEVRLPFKKTFPNLSPLDIPDSQP